MDQIPFGTDSFAENPEPRVPCTLILDVSGSMTGDPINQLNEGLLTYKQELSGDSLASKRVEVSVITFGATVETNVAFTTAANFAPPHLEPSGMTPMGEAVNRAIDELESRKQIYKANGIAYYRPWLFLITDGEPNDANGEAAAARCIAGEKAKSFAMFCVGVENANFAVLQKFTMRAHVSLRTNLRRRNGRDQRGRAERQSLPNRVFESSACKPWFAASSAKKQSRCSYDSTVRQLVS